MFEPREGWKQQLRGSLVLILAAGLLLVVLRLDGAAEAVGWGETAVVATPTPTLIAPTAPAPTTEARLTVDLPILQDNSI